MSFNDLKEDDIFSILNEIIVRENKDIKDYDYITGENYIFLEKFIKSNKLDNYLNYLKNCNYIDSKNELDYYFSKSKKESILEENDIKDDEDKIIVKYEEITDKIENYLNHDEFELLRTFCIKCCNNVRNKEKMLNILNSLLNYSKNNVYDLVDELEIRKTLIFLLKESRDNIIHFNRIKTIIREMQILELSSPDELMTRINKFSEIINERAFNIDFLEIIAEENLKNIEFVINKFYNGSDKNSAPPELKKKHVQIINDYMEIIEEKYQINKKKIFDGLQKIKGDNINELLFLFQNSLNKHEQLYYDLLVKTVLEQPDSETWIESYVTPIFKVIRNIIISLGAFKLASLTGSKILTALSVSISGATILKNVSDEIIKKYFSLKEEERNVFHLNEKNTPKSGFQLFKKKLKEKCKKMISPIKKYSSAFFNKKILRLKEENKIGFERKYDLKANENECDNYKTKIVTNYYINIKKVIEEKNRQKLLILQKKFKDKSRTDKPKEINYFFNTKKNIIKKEIDIEINELKKRYPEFKDNTLIENILKTICDVGSAGIGILRSVISVFSYGLANKLFSQKKNFEIILETIKNYKYKEFEKEMEEIKQKNENNEFLILKEDIKFLAKSSSEDNRIFNKMLENEKTEFDDIKREEIIFKIIIHNENLNNNRNINLNRNVNININENINYNNNIRMENIIENENKNTNIIINEDEGDELKERLLNNKGKI